MAWSFLMFLFCLFVCLRVIYLYFYAFPPIYVLITILYYNLLKFKFFLDTEISVYNLELFIYFTLSSIHLLVHTCIIRYIFLHFVVLIIITHVCCLLFLFVFCMLIMLSLMLHSIYVCFHIYIYIYAPVYVPTS